MATVGRWVSQHVGTGRPRRGKGTLDEIAAHLAAARHAVVIEGHTDGKGTDSYNQTLSERRANSVRASLASRRPAMTLQWIAKLGLASPKPVMQTVVYDECCDVREGNREESPYSIIDSQPFPEAIKRAVLCRDKAR